MNKILRLAVMSIAACGIVPSSAYTVGGRFIDRLAEEPCAMATYHIYNAADTLRPVVNDIADADGVFSAQLAAAGDYLLKGEYAGKLPLRVSFTVTDEEPDKNLGDLYFDDISRELQEVTVVSRKDLITSDGAKLTYDVARDPQSGTSTVIEMLRKVPMVSVDGEDNIQVKGSSDFRIYVNGKPDPMLSGDPKSVLKSMPASSVKKIEVITDPGAKLDAEGTGGILNIVTDRMQSIEGYLATLRAGVSNGSLNGSVYGRTKINKVTASLNFSGTDGRVMRPHTDQTTITEDFTSESDRYTRSDRRTQNKYDYLYANFNLSWEPDTLNLFTVSANLNSLNETGSTSESTRRSDIGNNPVWSYRRDFTTDYGWRSSSVQASYQHTFPHNAAHTLTLSYQWDFRQSPSQSYTYPYDFVNFDFEGYKVSRHRDSSEYSNTHTFQADYVLPLYGNRHTFETGAKILLRPQRGDARMYEQPDAASEYVLESAMKSALSNNVYAAYVSYSASFGDFSARAGVRYEHTDIEMKYRYLYNTGDYPDFTTRLNDLVPNASLTWALDESSSIRAAYSMRITRPSLSNLNPYVNTMTYGEVSYGNPDLKSVHSNKAGLTYLNYGGKLGGEFGVSYTRLNDMITSYSFMADNILNSTYANVGKASNVSISGYLTYTITPKMDAGIYAEAIYSDLRSTGVAAAHNHGWKGYFNLSYSYRMPCRFTLSAWGGYGTPSVNLQSKGDEWYYYGISLSRTFMRNDMLSANLVFNNLFPLRKTGKYTVETPQFRQTTSATYESFSIGLSVSLRLGGLGADVKRTKAVISNDDINKESSQQGSR